MTTDRWRRTTLSQAIGGGSAIRTGPFGSQLHASDYEPEGVPVVMPRDFARGSINVETLARVCSRKAAELSGFQVRANDVLLARRGEMGRCTRIETAHSGWLCGTGVLRIRPNGVLDSRFLTYLLRSPVTVSWLRDHAVGQTLPSLNVRTIASIPLLLPAIDEQRRIARILAAAEQAIDCSRRVMHQKRRLRDRFWRQLFTHGPARCVDNFDSLGVDSLGVDSLGRVDNMHPRDWELQPIGALCTMSNGFPFKTADRSATGLPIIRIKNLNGSREFHHFAGRPDRRWSVKAGDLLFAWAGVKGSSFGACLWPGPRGVLNQHIFRVQPNKGVSKEWLFETLKLVTQAIEDKARGFKNDLQHVRKSEVTEQLVPVPPFEIQSWIATLSRALAAIEAAERDSLDTLTRLKKGLAHDLLSGRVRT